MKQRQKKQYKKKKSIKPRTGSFKILIKLKNQIHQEKKKPNKIRNEKFHFIKEYHE